MRNVVPGIEKHFLSWVKRPLPVTLFSWFFILAGTVGFIYHLTELGSGHPIATESILILLVRLLAVAGGILVLRGSNIGRWILVVWILCHVVLSFYHTTSELIMHAVLAIAVITAFFYPGARAYFRGSTQGTG